MSHRVLRRTMPVVILGLLLLPSGSAAHDSVAAQIARMTARIAEEPASAELYLRRGELHRLLRHWNEALADLDRASDLDPSIVKVDLVRAQIFLATARHQASVEAASRFLAHHPDHVEALVVRGRARARLHHWRKAAEDFTAALARRPLPDLYVERARATRSLGRGGIESALRGLDEGIARLGSIVTLELEAIDLELTLNRYDAALGRLDRLSAQTTRQESWLARRGEILERAGRMNAARAAYRDALAAAQQLPPSLQQTRATSSLMTRLRTKIDSLARKGD